MSILFVKLLTYACDCMHVYQGYITCHSNIQNNLVIIICSLPTVMATKKLTNNRKRSKGPVCLCYCVVANVSTSWEYCPLAALVTNTLVEPVEWSIAQSTV